MTETIEISSEEAWRFLSDKHYAGRRPCISIAYGLIHNKNIVAACTFGKPASRTLCDGVCGKENSKFVYELNRLCRIEGWGKPISQFVANCLKKLKEKKWIIVSYSDSSMNHHGYVYQACNFLYTGKTKERTVEYIGDNKHSRHAQKQDQTGLRKIRSSKYRYVYFCADKKQVKQWKKDLRYKIEPYPKGENKNYNHGFVLKETIIESLQKLERIKQDTINHE